MSEHQTFDGLKAVFVNCTLKKSEKISHTLGLMDVSRDIMENEKVRVTHIRMVDHDIPPGIQPDMREEGWERDEWPALFEKINQADILILGTPIWLGDISSIASRFIERMYAMSGKLNDRGQSIFYGKVAGTIITGNEDGVKHCAMKVLYSLQHLGYSIPPQADSGWTGEIGPGPSYLDEESNAKNNDFTNRNTTIMTYNLLHLAQMLKQQQGYSNYGNSREEWENGTRWGFENPEYR